MSRSRKKYAVGSAHESEKIDKQIAHRVFRKRAKHALKSGRLSRLPYTMRDVSNIYSFSKDGKIYFSYHTYAYFKERGLLDVQDIEVIMHSSRK